MMKPTVAFRKFPNAPKNCLMLTLTVNKVTTRLHTVKHNQESIWGGGGGGARGAAAPGGKINILNERKLFSALNKF
jgi:hypothetical protein